MCPIRVVSILISLSSLMGYSSAAMGYSSAAVGYSSAAVGYSSAATTFNVPIQSQPFPQHGRVTFLKNILCL